MSDLVLQHLDRGLLTVTMNRPERRNALSAEMQFAMLDALHAATKNAEVRAILLKGAGGTFCVGGDIQAMTTKAPATLEENVTDLRSRMEISRLVHQMQKPVVAQVDGAAAGAGFSLALACDLRIASESAKITTAFAKIGFPGDYGGTFFLTKMIGSAKARELYLMSPVLSAQEALGLGIVTKVVPDAETEKVAHDVAMSLAQGPTIALGYIKKNINNAETMSLEDCFDGEALHLSRCRDSTDHKEAAKAFVEKRKPTFAGR
ncbi:1,2-epoxyphenylacetyl-CoA isomerase [Variibacter gotjawalensis]|uniref:1,2-epoxyphenylacetyl-CoA isomerase n=1 Tax=Variibacter gotjawalensis TaxID=1333996 RepID=A0A0S3PVQ3_9BRAD|nr:enoyl-CoA hydratase [Variibacter gotjawalensis]NIK45835.1 2-(1,2-epoxy-1,2-dihydrophenyl)acetyl-CoA isomerase [Variibacter gotjawalensis]RZS47759.1 enoyl-CoA hydratase [Variibacter gotjawalensis]BAT60013.1 1,2-epoxyphenylacetyl-CoA isomerase [Variibacter gotjawalensis]